MPKVISKKIVGEILAACQLLPQTVAARKYGVSRMYVNALVNGRKIKRTRPSKSKCPITGYKL